MTAICGVLGAWADESDAHATLEAMLAPLARPGSGRTATWVDPERRCRLGVAARFRRAEPRVLEQAGLVAVCDGEQLGVGPDALLRAWAAGGPAAEMHLDAHFALAVWDAQAAQLALARDALGVRSLYYYVGRGGLVFASTIEALLQHPAVPHAVDERGVAQFLTFLDVPTPRTLFAGISKLPPGTIATCRPNGAPELARAWDLLADPLPERDDRDYYVEGVRRRHVEALTARVAPGPIAALLSGGNDSSANVARLAAMGVGPLHTFTVGLAETEGQERFSDLVHARRVAQLSGTTHHERLLSETEFIAAMPSVIAAQDDLVSEPSSVFLHHALAMVHEAGLEVVITGEANDEISCGHREMAAIRDGYYRRWRPLLRTPRPVRRALAAVAPYVSPRHADVLARAADDGEYFWSFELGWTDHERDQILTPAAVERTRDAICAPLVAARARRIRDSAHGRRDYLSHVIATMMDDHYLGNLMLGKLDLLSSALGLDARCPYAAPAYVHFVYNIPARFQQRGDEVKACFRAAIADVLPDDIIHRPKQGFRTPLAELFRGAFGRWAEPLLLETGRVRAGILRQDTLATLLTAHRRGDGDRSTRLWTALVLNLWHDRWIGTSRGTGLHAERGRTSDRRHLPVVVATTGNA